MGAEVDQVESARSWDSFARALLAGLAAPLVEPRGVLQPQQPQQVCVHARPTRRHAAASFALRLVETCDLVFENYRADVIGKLRLDYADLRAVKPDIHPRLDGESRQERAGIAPCCVRYENVEQLSGLAALNGYAGMVPHKSAIAYGDPNAGAIAAAGGSCRVAHRRAHRRGAARRKWRSGRR